MLNKKVLIHPDIFYSHHSGAIAAREAARQLNKLGYEIAIFTKDKENKSIADYRYYESIPYRGTSNYFPSKYKASFTKVIENFRPDYMFFIGGVTDTPVIYIDLCLKFKIKTVFLILVQDFYCARLHAGLGTSSCTKCLDYSNLNAFVNNCGEKQKKPNLFLLNYQLNQRMFLSRLRSLDYVLGSSNQQLEFYKKIGIKHSNIKKIPLFFPQNRVQYIKKKIQSYFVIIGQFRHEKGIHLISKIIDNIDDNISVKLLLFTKEEADKFSANTRNKVHIKSKKLEVIHGLTMTNGAIELIASSVGVINPTIWATTTEFVLLEILGMAKPIITFDVGIHKEILINRFNSICVKSGDFVSMGQEINNLNNDKKLQKLISIESLKLYNRLTSEESFTKILKDIFI
jgi:glycosyltransferase involved in cell wall biosynthesis